MDKNKRLVTDMVLDALRQSGIKIKKVSDEQARQFIAIDEYRTRARFSVGNPIFYSNAAHVLAGIRQEYATGSQWLAMLTNAGGIKAGEDKWTGLSEWLHGQADRKIARSDIQKYMAEQAIEVKETVFVDEWYMKIEDHPLQLKMDDYVSEAEEEIDSLYPQDHYDHAFERMIEEYGDDFDIAFGQENGKLYITSSSFASEFLGEYFINATRLDYTTEGLLDKKEIALYVPGIEPWNEDDEIHFGEVGDGRCIAWIRFGTGVITKRYSLEEYKTVLNSMPSAGDWLKSETGGPYNAVTWRPPVQSGKYPDAHIWEHNGRYLIMGVKDILSYSHPSLNDAVQAYNRHVCPKQKDTKVLVIDEIQSKRLQEAKEEGFRQEIAEDAPVKIRLEKAQDQYHDYLDALRSKYGRTDVSYGLTQQEQDRSRELARICQEARLEYNNYMMEHKLGNFSKSQIPETPFLKNWHELCMKRMLRYAAENGFDKMAWTKGDEQTERYNIAERIENIEAYDDIVEYADGTPYAKEIYLDLEGEKNLSIKVLYETGKVKGGKYDGRALSEIVGKELAVKLMQQGDQKISGEGLTIGGEGMKDFYDKMLPAFMNKYGKKWGVRTQELKIPLNFSEKTFHGIDVTPAMRESVMQGQPMFMKDNKGVVYGWTLDDTIYLTKKGLNAETAIHEYTHLWADIMRRKDRPAWEHVKSLLRDTPVWEEVKKDRYYRHIRNNDDELANETLARVSGRNNAEKLEQAVRQATKRDHSIRGLEQVKQALGKFWSWVGRHIFNIRQARSVTDVTDRILGDLLRGTRPDLHHPERDGRITDIQIRMFGQAPNQVPRLRCRIDSEQQLYVDITRKEFENIQREKDTVKRENLQQQLVLKYFAGQFKQSADRNLKR